jgi:hypothetical protein
MKPHRTTPLPCIVCGKELASVFDKTPTKTEWDWRQASGAAEFTSGGHYGSAFDPGSGRISIAINVCDGCLRERRLRVVYFTEKPKQPDYEYTEFMPWLDEEPSDAGGES